MTQQLLQTIHQYCSDQQSLHILLKTFSKQNAATIWAKLNEIEDMKVMQVAKQVTDICHICFSPYQHKPDMGIRQKVLRL